MWLPLWPATLKPFLVRALIIVRQDVVGSFSDSYLHQLFFAFKLVHFFGKSF
jgi:hypothetical protein